MIDAKFGTKRIYEVLVNREDVNFFFLNGNSLVDVYVEKGLFLAHIFSTKLYSISMKWKNLQKGIVDNIAVNIKLVKYVPDAIC